MVVHPSGERIPSSYIRQYHRVFLSQYYRISPHLRSSSRRPKSFRRGREGERRGGSDERERKGREREIEFLGCILKPVELSGNCREANSVVQDFPFCVPIFPPSLFLSIHSIYLYKRNKWVAFHLSNVALWLLHGITMLAHL